MKLSELKSQLSDLNELRFVLPDGTGIPPHIHVTEVGQITRHFVDCGGTVRTERAVNFQLWEDGDFDHRLAPQKLMDIINLSERLLGLEDGDIEVEYQADTICKYGLTIDQGNLHLTLRHTDCLAKESCGIPKAKPRIRLSEIGISGSGCCTPGEKCC